MEQCSKKWKNLRDQFVRELKKKPSGEKGLPYVSRWHFFELLMFLSDTVCHRGYMSAMIVVVYLYIILQKLLNLW